MSINPTAKAGKFVNEIYSEAQIPTRKLVFELNKSGYTQTQIAKWAGVDVATVNRWIKKEQHETK